MGTLWSDPGIVSPCSPCRGGTSPEPAKTSYLKNVDLRFRITSVEAQLSTHTASKCMLHLLHGQVLSIQKECQGCFFVVGFAKGLYPIHVRFVEGSLKSV